MPMMTLLVDPTGEGIYQCDFQRFHRFVIGQAFKYSFHILWLVVRNNEGLAIDRVCQKQFDWQITISGVLLQSRSVTAQFLSHSWLFSPRFLRMSNSRFWQDFCRTNPSPRGCYHRGLVSI